MAEKDPDKQTQDPQTSPAPQKKKREKPLPAVHPERLESVEYVRTVWRLTPEVGTEPEELLAPDYWAHLANRLRQCDRIEAWAEDMSWYAEYLVLDVGANWAKVHLCENSIEELGEFDPRRAKVVLTGHTVEYKGRVAKWCVIRDKDKALLKDKFATEGDGLSWLSEYSKTIAA